MSLGLEMYLLNHDRNIFQFYVVKAMSHNGHDYVIRILFKFFEIYIFLSKVHPFLISQH